MGERRLVSLCARYPCLYVFECILVCVDPESECICVAVHVLANGFCQCD